MIILTKLRPVVQKLHYISSIFSELRSTMDIRGAVVVKTDEDEDDNNDNNESNSRNEDVLQRRKNFRSETFAYSSDRTTIEDMADHVISR